MDSDTPLIFEVLNDKHDPCHFRCGESDLDEFLIDDAFDNQSKCLSVTKLVIHDDELIGYFTLVASTVNSRKVHKIGCGEVDDYPYNDYPAIKIARFAVMENKQRMGYGSLILQEIFKIVFNMSNNVGIRFILVDSKKNEKAPIFYRNFSFTTVKDQGDTISMCLDFLALKKLATS